MLHDAVTCASLNESHLKYPDGKAANDVKPIVSMASDLWTLGEDSTDLNTEMPSEDCEFEIEPIESNAIYQIPFKNYDDSMESAEFESFATPKIEPEEEDEEDAEEEEKEEEEAAAAHIPQPEQCSSRSVFHTKCGICKKLFLDLTELDNHMKSVHMNNGTGFQCDICWKTVKSKHGLNVHKRYCHDEANIWKFNCNRCKVPFMEESALQQHQCDDSPVDKLICELCGRKGFPTTYALKCHVAFKHKNKRNHGNHVCELCTRNFDTAEQRDKHRIGCSHKRNNRVSKGSGERATCNKCGKVPKIQVFFHSSNQLFCSLCARTFNTQEKASAHRAE